MASVAFAGASFADLSLVSGERHSLFTCFESWALFVRKVHRVSSFPDAHCKTAFQRPAGTPNVPKSRRVQKQSTPRCRRRPAEGKRTWRQWLLRKQGPEHYRIGDCMRGFLKRRQINKSAWASAGGEPSVRAKSPEPRVVASGEAVTVRTDLMDDSGGDSPRSSNFVICSGSASRIGSASGASSPSSFSRSDAVHIFEALRFSPTFEFESVGINECCVLEGLSQHTASSPRQVAFQGLCGSGQSLQASRPDPQNAVPEATTCVQGVSTGDSPCSCVSGASNPSVKAHESLNRSPTFSFEGNGTDRGFAVKGLVQHHISSPLLAMAFALPAGVSNLADLSWGRASVMPLLTCRENSEEFEAEMPRDTILEEVAPLRRRPQSLQPNLGTSDASAPSFVKELDSTECAHISDDIFSFGTVVMSRVSI